MKHLELSPCREGTLGEMLTSPDLTESMVFLVHRALKAPEVTKENLENLARGD